MKQSHKNLIINYLDNRKNNDIWSVSRGYTQLYNSDVNGIIRGTNHFDTLLYSNENIIEEILLHKFLIEKMPKNWCSYKLTYNKETKKIEGIVTYKKIDSKDVDLDIRIPEDFWYDSAGISIMVSNKKNVSVNFNINIKNGFYPNNHEKVINSITSKIQCDLFDEFEKVKGRVSYIYHSMDNLSFKNKKIKISYENINYLKKKVNISIK